MSREYKEVPDTRSASRAYRKIRNDWKKGKRQHEWDWDTGDGTTCINCGDKDWLADKYCDSGESPNASDKEEV